MGSWLAVGVTLASPGVGRLGGRCRYRSIGLSLHLFVQPSAIPFAHYALCTVHSVELDAFRYFISLNFAWLQHSKNSHGCNSRRSSEPISDRVTLK